MADTAETNDGLVEYRLNIIERKIDNLTEIVALTSDKMHAIPKLQDEAQEAKETLKDHEIRIRELELAPTKSKAARFQEVIDSLFKAITSLGITAVLVKIGLKV